MMHSISWYHVTAFVSGYNISQLLGRLLYVVIKDIQPPGTNIGVVLTQVAMGVTTGVLVTLEIRDFYRRPEQLVTPMVTQRIEHTGGLILEERTTWTTHTKSTKTYFLPYDGNVCTLRFYHTAVTLPEWELPPQILMDLRAYLKSNVASFTNTDLVIRKLNDDIVDCFPIALFAEPAFATTLGNLARQREIYRTRSNSIVTPDVHLRERFLTKYNFLMSEDERIRNNALVTVDYVKDKFKNNPPLRMLYMYLYS
jgi:hypothetical protein